MERRHPTWPPWPTSINHALCDLGYDPMTFPTGSGLSQAEVRAIKGALEIVVRQSWPEQERRLAEGADDVLAKLVPIELPPHLQRPECLGRSKRNVRRHGVNIRSQRAR